MPPLPGPLPLPGAREKFADLGRGVALPPSPFPLPFHWRDDLLSALTVVFSLICAIGLMFPWAAQAMEFDYRLAPRQVAPDTWAFIGATEDFSPANGGNIVNTGFIVTKAGVLVIDTGPSLRYGEQMRQAIHRITEQPVVQVVNTHHHPDHFLGNQAFAGLPILALPETAQGQESQGGAFADNMYRMNGEWMRGTEPLPATQTDVPARLLLGGHDIEFLRLAGHTAGDLAVFDRTTGVLFSGDLVFHDRTPTTPHADIKRWLQGLAQLEALPFKVLVPGHGTPTTDAAPIAQTRDWLQWLNSALRQGAASGIDMAEMLRQPLPARFAAMPLSGREYQRSVSHLFPRMEQDMLEGRKP